MVVCTIAVGAVWMVLSPAPIAKPKGDERATRPLAYQQAISQPHEAEPSGKAEAPKEAEAPQEAEVPPFETVTTEETPPPSDGATNPTALPELPPDESMDAPQDLASLPDESADAQDGMGASDDVAALPGEDPAPYDEVPPMPGEAGAESGEWGTDGAEQWRDERGQPSHGQPWANGPPPQADPYGPPGAPPRGDPYGPPGATDAYGNDPYGNDPYGPPPGQAGPYGAPQGEQWSGDPNAEEWVEVIISGAAMRATASEDAPLLFAFPYGRNLKVVSRYEGWVEVTDPKSSATGWMQAHQLAPSSVNRQPYGQGQAYYDDDRRRGRGWFERNADEFSNMLNRAFGGGGGY